MGGRKIVELWTKGSYTCPKCGHHGWSQNTGSAIATTMSFHSLDNRFCPNNHYWKYESFIAYDKPPYTLYIPDNTESYEE